MTKQEKIIEAYGEYWKCFKNVVDENGFVWQSTFFYPDSEMFKDGIEIQAKGFEPDGRVKWRPKSLQGIENNNGLIKIESESDVPKTGYYEVIERESGKQTRGIISNDLAAEECIKYYSHYQPIQKPLKPIY